MTFFLGAFIGAWILSRFLRWLLFKRTTEMRRAVGPNAAALVVATILGGFGLADGGSPQFLFAFLVYGVPLTLLTVFDVYRESRRQTVE